MNEIKRTRQRLNLSQKAMGALMGGIGQEKVSIRERRETTRIERQLCRCLVVLGEQGLLDLVLGEWEI